MLILHKIIFVNKKFVKKKLRPARRNFSLPFCSLRILSLIHIFFYTAAAWRACRPLFCRAHPPAPPLSLIHISLFHCNTFPKSSIWQNGMPFSRFRQTKNPAPRIFAHKKIPRLTSFAQKNPPPHIFCAKKSPAALKQWGNKACCLSFHGIAAALLHFLKHIARISAGIFPQCRQTLYAHQALCLRIR